jgi:chromate transporter
LKRDNPRMSQTSPEAPVEAPPEKLAPKSLSDLFISFTLLALQGFGGVMAVVQRGLVEDKRWLTREEFLEDWAVAQVMPGPNVVNMAMMVGDRHFGLRGALVGMAGMLTVPLLLVLSLGFAYGLVADNPHVAGALRGMAAVAAGLITATGLKLMLALKKHPLGVPACILIGVSAFVCIALLRWPLVWVLLGLGGTACVLTYRKMGKHGA